MRNKIGGNPRVTETISETEKCVRIEDRDRYIATLFAPSAVRQQLFALHAFDLTLADVVRTTNEPQIGMIRLAWWRDSVRELHEKPVTGQPVLAAVAAAGLGTEPLEALVETYMDIFEGADIGGCGAAFFLCAAAVLGADETAGLADAGRFWAQASARRSSDSQVVPFSALRFAAPVRPVTALAAVARRDAAGRREPRGAMGRQFTVLRHILTGRV